MQLGNFPRDVWTAVRTLSSTPATALVAIGTLGGGLALTASAFGLVKGVWIRPLDLPGADRLVTVSNTIPAAQVASFPLSPPEFRAFDGEALGPLAGHQPVNFNLGGVEQPVFVSGGRVTAGFFSVLGAQPLVGRLPTASADWEEGPPVAVIAESLWRGVLGTAADVPGREILLDGVSHQVIAVVPDRQAYPRQARVWTPLAFAPAAVGPDGLGRQFVRVTGRLPAGIPPAQAEERLARTATAFHGIHAGFYGDANEWRVEVRRVVDTIRARVGAPVALVAGAVLILFLITVGNVAGLLGARAIDRASDAAVRMALGARRWQVARTALVEGAVIGAVAGASGVVAAWVASPAVTRLGPLELLDFPVRVDGPVVVAMLAVAFLASASASVLPVWHTVRQDPATFLRASAGLASPSRWSRGALVALQVAGTFLLLSTSFGLMQRFLELSRQDPGFDPDGVLTARASLPAATVPAPGDAVADILESARGLPEVEEAGAVTVLPLSGRDSRAAFYLEDATVERPSGTTSLHQRFATPGYLRALRLPLLAGRWIDEGDDAQAPAVVVVNRTFADRVWPGRDPIGRRITLDSQSPWVTVVGVVDDVRHAGLDSAPLLEAFYPYAQAPDDRLRETTFVLRGRGELAGLVASLRRVVEARLPAQPLFRVLPMDAVISDSLGGRRLSAALPAVFAVIALALSMFAVYGSVRTTVAKRTREFGVRRALGAPARRIVLNVLGLGVGPVVVGLGVGAALGPLLMPGIASLVPGASWSDPLWAVVAAGTLLAGAVVGTGSVARRAVRVDPVSVIREE